MQIRHTSTNIWEEDFQYVLIRILRKCIVAREVLFQLLNGFYTVWNKKLCENLHILYTIVKILKYGSLILIFAYSSPVPDEKCYILAFENSPKSYLEAEELKKWISSSTNRHLGFMQIRHISTNNWVEDFQYVILGISVKCIVAIQILLQLLNGHYTVRNKKLCVNLHILYKIVKIVKYRSLILIFAYSIPVSDEKCHILAFGNSPKCYLEAEELNKLISSLTSRHLGFMQIRHISTNNWVEDF